ncbi:MAG: LTA synthase family protein [Pseudomonadota bacterium]
MKHVVTSWFYSRFRIVPISFTLFIVINFLVRIALIFFNGDFSLLSPKTLFPALAIGFIYDFSIILWWLFPLVLAIACLPWQKKFDRLFVTCLYGILFSLTGLLIFIHAAEFVFWNEFSSRFNFIAVDYLIYTREVVGNIKESYHLTPLLAGIAALTGLVVFYLSKPLAHTLSFSFLKRSHRWLCVTGYFGLALITTFTVNTSWKEKLIQPQAVQIAANGIWEFFYAFRFNEIDYTRFYATLPKAIATDILQKEFSDPHLYTLALNTSMPIQRQILTHGHEKKMNVVMVSIESLGAEFIESLGGKPGLTPNFERLGKEGLFFSHLYATGTRTVRGLEALTLSVPPTPGHAIPMRLHNTGLFTLGGVFKSKGYVPIYIYGGYSYFDNMNAFFSGNGYTVFDRQALSKNEITHENIWGVCDEDLFKLAIKEIDLNVASGKHVFAHVMTTSNHRPFTYPEGRINIASGTGREGAVKYTDYAIGHFIEEAKKKPWFNNTLFVFVADHTSIARGRTDLAMERYHIPMIMYAPSFIKPQRIDTPASQIDVPPTILGQLNWSYNSQFFGRDILRDGAKDPHIFMANYQTVGFVDNGLLIELRPKQSIRLFGSDGHQETSVNHLHALNEAIAFYQTASSLFQ